MSTQISIILPDLIHDKDDQLNGYMTFYNKTALLPLRQSAANQEIYEISTLCLYPYVSIELPLRRYTAATSNQGRVKGSYSKVYMKRQNVNFLQAALLSKRPAQIKRRYDFTADYNDK